MGILNDFNAWLFGPKGWWFGVCISFLILTIFMALIASHREFNPWGEVTCDRALGYASEQCEFISRDGFLRQQANFWSNFAYLAVGLFIFFRSDAVIARAVGLAFVFLCIGSALFHGTLTTWGQYLDVMGIDIVLALLVLQAVIGTFQLDLASAPILSWIGFLTMAGIFMGLFKGVSIFGFHLFDSTVVSVSAAVVFLVLGAWAIKREQGKAQQNCGWCVPALLAVICFGGAVAFKFADGREVMATCGAKIADCCADVFEGVSTSTIPSCVIQEHALCFGAHSIVQGHAMWHVLSALGMLWIFDFFDALHGTTAKPK
jgi:hypothetical protein